MADKVTIKGMDKLLRKLKTVEELRGARRGLQAGAVHIKDIFRKYPPETAANASQNPSGRWYERGYGPRWRRKDDSWGGRQTSETLSKKWAISERAGGLQQVIGNNASYAPYVHDADEQAKFHGDRGWKTDKEVIEEEGEEVLKFVQHEVERELSG
jgi:hypothetical protein